MSKGASTNSCHPELVERSPDSFKVGNRGNDERCFDKLEMINEEKSPLDAREELSEPRKA
jgi:hypothetical protein